MTTETAGTPLDRFLWSCCDEIDRRASLAVDHREILADGARAFRSALENATVVEREPVTVPAVGWIRQLRPSPLVDMARLADDELPWLPSPRIDDCGTRVALALVDEVRDLGPVTCGIMLLAPRAEYPEHSHPPNEIYLPLAVADSAWRFGGHDDYRRLAPDELVYNQPNDRHGTVAGSEPVLALYVLW